MLNDVYLKVDRRGTSNDSSCKSYGHGFTLAACQRWGGRYPQVHQAALVGNWMATFILIRLNDFPYFYSNWIPLSLLLLIPRLPLHGLRVEGVGGKAGIEGEDDRKDERNVTKKKIYFRKDTIELISSQIWVLVFTSLLCTFHSFSFPAHLAPIF